MGRFCLAECLRLENPSFAEQKGFGGANEIKMCLHIFMNERKSELARDIPVSPPKALHLAL